MKNIFAALAFTAALTFTLSLAVHLPHDPALWVVGFWIVALVVVLMLCVFVCGFALLLDAIQPMINVLRGK